MANAPIVVTEGDDDLELEYDSDGYPIIPDSAKVDHTHYDITMTSLLYYY